MYAPFLLAAAMLVQASPGQEMRALEAVSVGGTTVSLRSSEQDGVVEEQVRRVLPEALRLARRWGALPEAITLTIHATHAGLEEATGRVGNAWMRAWARASAVDLQSPRTWTRGRASDGDLTRMLAHEFTHCVLFHATGRDGRAREIPVWFVEGMASTAAREHHHRVLPEAISSPQASLRADPRAVYGTADRAFRELVARFGEDRVRDLVTRLGEGHAFGAAFRDALGVAPAEFETDLVVRLSAVAALHQSY